MNANIVFAYLIVRYCRTHSDKVIPSCLLKQIRSSTAGSDSTTAHSPQVGWALDGFPSKHYSFEWPISICITPLHSFLHPFISCLCDSLRSAWITRIANAALHICGYRHCVIHTHTYTYIYCTANLINLTIWPHLLIFSFLCDGKAVNASLTAAERALIASGVCLDRCNGYASALPDIDGYLYR
jgi:hypothetical protein